MNQKLLQELAARWVSRTDGEAQRAVWNRAAADYREISLPDPEKDAFLRRMGERVKLTDGIRTLDVGCGSGVYSLALAQMGAETMGVDIAGNMIDIARARAEEMGLAKTAFSCLDWSEADVDALGLRGNFDVAFAHMTPAISDYATVDRLNACSRNLCMLEKPTRRTDAVMDAAFASIGLPTADFDSGMPDLFTYLWAKGYEPEFFYHQEVWEPLRSIEDMTAWCVNRARLRRALTPAEEAEIARTVRDRAENGMVREHTATTRVTVIWRV